VVMIVMLAFSGTLGERVGDTPEVMLADASPGLSDPVAPADAPEVPASDATVADTPQGSETISAAFSVSETAGSGLLPGGAGLLPGHAGMADTAAVSEPLPGWTATWAMPFPAPHPADVGPLPREASAVPDSAASPSVSPPPSTGLDALYPGWSAADLAASFIGPRQPVSRSSAPATDTEASPTDSAASAAYATGAVLDEEPPSEGETMAAGLALGELGNDVEVVVNERSVSFRVNSEILFDSSQADLSRSGLSVLRRIVSVLSDTSHGVTVEGHTDSVPVRRNVRYPSNWELSSARAGSVVRYLQANGIDRSRLKAVGYADTRPIADNHSPSGRASNRRVELLLEKRP